MVNAVKSFRGIQKAGKNVTFRVEIVLDSFTKNESGMFSGMTGFVAKLGVVRLKIVLKKGKRNVVKNFHKSRNNSNESVTGDIRDFFLATFENGMEGRVRENAREVIVN